MADKKKIDILILEDEIGDDLINVFEKIPHGKYEFKVTLARSVDELSEILKERRNFQVSIVDLSVPICNEDVGLFALKLLSPIKRTFPSAIQIVYTGNYDQEVHVEAIKEGAIDCINKANCVPSRLPEKVIGFIESKFKELEEEFHVMDEVLPFHQEWLEKYKNKYIAIYDDQIVASGETPVEALFNAWKENKEIEPFVLLAN